MLGQISRKLLFIWLFNVRVLFDTYDLTVVGGHLDKSILGDGDADIVAGVPGDGVGAAAQGRRAVQAQARVQITSVWSWFTN